MSVQTTDVLKLCRIYFNAPISLFMIYPSSREWPKFWPNSYFVRLYLSICLFSRSILGTDHIFAFKIGERFKPASAEWKRKGTKRSRIFCQNENHELLIILLCLIPIVSTNFLYTLLIQGKGKSSIQSKIYIQGILIHLSLVHAFTHSLTNNYSLHLSQNKEKKCLTSKSWAYFTNGDRHLKRSHPTTKE